VDNNEFIDLKDWVYLPAFNYSLLQEDLKPLVIKDLKKRIKSLEDYLKKNIVEQRTLKNSRISRDNTQLIYLELQHESTKQTVKYLSGKLQWLEHPPRKREGGETDWEHKKIAARAVPLTNFIDVNRSGFACCPIHKEKTPSFKYYPKDNHWHCFGCGQGGDVIDFIMATKDLDFRKAVNFLIGQ